MLAVGHSDDDVEVYDNWEGSPGASVVAAGETTTREGRLLSWANEIEALFASQASFLWACNQLMGAFIDLPAQHAAKAGLLRMMVKIIKPNLAVELMAGRAVA